MPFSAPSSSLDLGVISCCCPSGWWAPRVVSVSGVRVSKSEDLSCWLSSLGLGEQVCGVPGDFFFFLDMKNTILVPVL